jgi:hypothetical protein
VPSMQNTNYNSSVDNTSQSFMPLDLEAAVAGEACKDWPVISNISRTPTLTRETYI